MTTAAGTLLRVCRLLMHLRVPGRYLMADVAGRWVAHWKRYVEGKVGQYAVRFDLLDQIQRFAYFGIYDEREIASTSALTSATTAWSLRSS